jgi:2-polyprenyl-3-methyl-5-hydroxy-6-metoxy-1,4-benzoquinol methylase
MYTEAECAARLTKILAPRTGDMGKELTLELSEYFSRPAAEIEQQLAGATENFTAEWQARVADARDERAVTKFYNESKTELFDLAQWHSTDTIHFRALICADIAAAGLKARTTPEARTASDGVQAFRPVPKYLDYGSGIGSDALVFADAGFEVTLADVADPLLAFAKWRCERRGLKVQTIDLKRRQPPERAYDAVVCFDVLEHVHRPLRTLDHINQSMRPGGFLFVHAPFGEDPDRPMHVVHEDVITPRMHTVGFNWRGDLEQPFPQWLWHPRVYQSFDISAIDRLGYRVYDSWLGQRVGAPLAKAYRKLRPNRHAA